MKRNKLSFLSKSVMLEEKGLPRMSSVIILVITIIVVLFIYWASILNINEKIVLSGFITPELVDKNTAVLNIPANSIASVEVGNPVYITIDGVTTKDTIKGIIVAVDLGSYEDAKGEKFFNADVDLNLTERQLVKLKQVVSDRFIVKSEVVIGHRSLLSYMLGPVWDIGEEAISTK